MDPSCNDYPVFEVALRFLLVLHSLILLSNVCTQVCAGLVPGSSTTVSLPACAGSQSLHVPKRQFRASRPYKSALNSLPRFDRGLRYSRSQGKRRYARPVLVFVYHHNSSRAACWGTIGLLVVNLRRSPDICMPVVCKSLRYQGPRPSYPRVWSYHLMLDPQ